MWTEPAPYAKKYEKVTVWTFYSNPAEKDTDGDRLSDKNDLNPKKYDITILKKTKDKLVFNTGRTWYTIKCTAYDYLDNCWGFVDNSVKNPMSAKKLKQVSSCIQKNQDQKFKIEELAAVGILNNEGSKLYMDNCSGKTREKVFQRIVGRKSDKYRHKGILRWETWKKAPKNARSGFFKGKVLTEADINFSNKIYYVCDVYTVMDNLVKVGAVVMAVVLVAKATPVVTANLQGIVYYCKTYGIKNGLDMYVCMGIRGVPDGIMSVVQKDLEDGDSDMVEAVKYANNVVYSEENVWEKPPIKRGNIIDRLLGNNLGHNFPIIDKIGNRTVTSFKSVDLTARTYQSRNKLYRVLARYVRQLAGFKGKRWNAREIRPIHYDTKVLEIAIPDITITGEQKLAFDAVKEYAKEQGIKIIITVIKK